MSNRECSAEAGIPHHPHGCYLVMEGPQFSTRAESVTYWSWNVDVIGMTNLQETKLAREAEMCYAVMAHVTDYDVWHEGEEPVTVEMVVITQSEEEVFIASEEGQERMARAIASGIEAYFRQR